MCMPLVALLRGRASTLKRRGKQETSSSIVCARIGTIEQHVINIIKLPPFNIHG